MSSVLHAKFLLIGDGVWICELPRYKLVAILLVLQQLGDAYDL